MFFPEREHPIFYLKVIFKTVLRWIFLFRYLLPRTQQMMPKTYIMLFLNLLKQI